MDNDDGPQDLADVITLYEAAPPPTVERAFLGRYSAGSGDVMIHTADGRPFVHVDLDPDHVGPSPAADLVSVELQADGTITIRLLSTRGYQVTRYPIADPRPAEPVPHSERLVFGRHPGT